jgi:FeS assembly SUF system protein
MAAEVTKEKVLEVLRDCYDPEIPVNIVDLGLVYDIKIDGPKVEITMTLTALGCPLADEVLSDIKLRVEEIEGVEECTINLTYDPPWTPDRMSEEAKWELGLI